jgi:hypothetical protein
MQPIIGYKLGAGQTQSVRQTLRLAILAATVILSAGFILVQTVPDALIRLSALPLTTCDDVDDAEGTESQSRSPCRVVRGGGRRARSGAPRLAL